MSILTSGVIIGQEQLDRPYIYPMSNATNGGESHTEYNMRSALANLVSYSAAFSMEDFEVTFKSDAIINNQDFEYDIPISISAGRGNCNAYFVKLDNFGTPDFPKNIHIIPKHHIPEETNDIEYDFRFGLYLCVNYCNTIADGLCYRFICDGYRKSGNGVYETSGTEHQKLYNDSYKSQGFNDIGICLGWSIYKNKAFSSFIPNPNKTRCIDLDRLGDETEFSDKLSKLITRLQTLNIFGGDFYISNTIIDGEDVGSDGIIDALGSDLRLKFSFKMNDVGSDDDSIPWKDASYYVLTDESKDYLTNDGSQDSVGIPQEKYKYYVNGKYDIDSKNIPYMEGIVSAEENPKAIFTRAIYDTDSWNLKYKISRKMIDQNCSESSQNSIYKFVSSPKSAILENIEPNIAMRYTYIAYGTRCLRGVYSVLGEDVKNSKVASLTYYDNPKSQSDGYGYITGTKLKWVNGFSSNSIDTGKENGKHYYLSINTPWTPNGTWIPVDTNCVYAYSEIYCKQAGDAFGNELVYFVAYDKLKGTWKSQPFRFVNTQVGLETILADGETGVFLSRGKNYYYKNNSGNIVELGTSTHPNLPNGDNNWFPVPISKKYFFDGSGRSTHPTGLKTLTGKISLVRTELGGTDENLTDLVTFTTKPIIVPFTGSDEDSMRIRLVKNIELDSKYIEFVQNITANQIYANRIDSDELISNNLILKDEIGNSVSAVYQKINGTSDGILVNGDLKANRVYGAVWM